MKGSNISGIFQAFASAVVVYMLLLWLVYPGVSAFEVVKLRLEIATVVFIGALGYTLGREFLASKQGEGPKETAQSSSPDSNIAARRGERTK